MQGLDSHTLRAAGGWMGGPRRRSDEGCVRRLTQRGRLPPKKLATAFVAESDRFIESGGFSLLPETMPISCALTVRIFWCNQISQIPFFERVMV